MWHYDPETEHFIHIGHVDPNGRPRFIDGGTSVTRAHSTGVRLNLNGDGRWARDVLGIDQTEFDRLIASPQPDFERRLRQVRELSREQRLAALRVLDEDD